MTNPAKTILTGRSSSHFTRVARVVAAECGVEYELRVVRDLLSLAPADYAGHPALKLPVLENARGVWFGTLNICREFQRMATRQVRIVWPEALDIPLLSNAQELVLHAMGNEVSLLMSKASGAHEPISYEKKVRQSLENSLAWLDAQAPAALAALPSERDTSFLEITLFCMFEHVGFREVLPTDGYANLRAFCERIAGRPALRSTAYRLDA